MFGKRYVIWIEFNDGDEGYFYKYFDGKVFYKYNPHNAKIYTSLLSASYEEGYYLSNHKSVRRAKVVEL